MQYKWFKMILQFTIKPGVVDFLITTALCFVIVSTVSMVTTGLVSLKWIYNNICGMCFLILYCDLTSTVTALSFIPIMNRSVTTNLCNDAGLQHCLSVTWLAWLRSPLKSQPQTVPAKMGRWWINYWSWT